MEAEPPLYPVAGAAGPQGDEDRLGVPDGPEAPVSEDRDREGMRGPRGPGSPPGLGCGWPGWRAPGVQGLGCGVQGTLPDANAVRTPQLDELVGAYPNYNEEEEERRYYRRKRLGVLKNVLAASAGGMLTYGVYLGTCPLRAQRGARRGGTRRPAGSGA